MEIIKNYEQFTELSQQEIMVLIAKTKTCVVCKPITEKLDDFLKDYEEVPSYQLFLEDVEMFQGQNLVFTVPTILIFSEGKEILRESRFIDFDKIKRLLDLYLEK